MKQQSLFRRVLPILLVLVVVGAGMLCAAPLTNTLNRHNLSSNATHTGPKAAAPLAGGTDRICIFCHTPHSGTPGTPLWSRPDTSMTGFPLYAQPLAIKGQTGQPGDIGLADAKSRSGYTDDGSVTYPNGSSRLCLSCHDGVTAINILNDNTTIAMAGGDFVTGTAVIDLSTTHPISFIYNDNVLTTDVLPARGAGTYQLPPAYQTPPGVSNVDVPLDGMNRMQCTTCHDPHDDSSLDDASLPPFWRHTQLQDNLTYADQYEEVCGQCHLGIGLNPGDLDPNPAGDHNPGPVFNPRP